MRISDWSSDVCSSDLAVQDCALPDHPPRPHVEGDQRCALTADPALSFPAQIKEAGLPEGKLRRGQQILETSGIRSEEHSVWKECDITSRYWWSRHPTQ